MINFEEIEFWPILAGLGLFLFGMYMLEGALKKLAGRSFKVFLRRQTNRTFKAIFSGAFVTAILQSSSLVTLLVMSLAGAGIIGLSSGIGMIMGANLGTTATGWLVSQVGFKMDIEAFILPFLAIGGLGTAFLKKEILVNLSKLLMGFSFMFLGLNYMKNSFADLATQFDLSVLADKPLILFFISGLVLTALIQSSSASMTIYLASLAAGIISLPQAAYLAIGSDLGTTVTGLIGTLNGNSIRKKIGWSQFFFNLITSMLALAIFDLLFYVIIDLIGVDSPLTSLVLFHSLFNLAGILLVWPFLKYFTRMIEKYINTDAPRISKHLVTGNPAEIISGLEALEKETGLLIDHVIIFNESFFKSSVSNSGILADYFKIKQYENEITRFYIPLQQAELNESEAIKINHLIATVRNISLSAKDMKDIKHNLDELQNAVSSNAQQLHGLIKKNQRNFYTEVKAMLRNLENVNALDLEKLNQIQNSFYSEETENLYSSFSAEQDEISVASCLNMLREINSSNQSLIKALNNLVEIKQPLQLNS